MLVRNTVFASETVTTLAFYREPIYWSTSDAGTEHVKVAHKNVARMSITKTVGIVIITVNFAFSVPN